MKNTISEIKDSMGSFNRTDTAEDIISNVEDRLIENTQIEPDRRNNVCIYFH